MKKARGYPKGKPWVRGMHAEQKISVARGFGPTHAENAKEGEVLRSPKGVVGTDTVPAMLTPREAVLNRNAAEMAGRGNIESLNAQGNTLARKGIDLAGGGKTMKPKKYQQGTGNADPYAQGPQPQQVMQPGYPQQAPPPQPYPPPATFFPTNPPQQQPVQAQGGAPDVQPIGAPQGGYPWQMVPLTGGQLSALQKEMEKQGLNKDQIAGLTQAFKGFGGAGGQAAPGAGAYSAAGSPTMVYGSSGYPSAIPVGGYQGGISDIGYPPFVAPNAVYHKDSGGWQGAYDPNYMIPWRG